jgi:hypothetical protein
VSRPLGRVDPSVFDRLYASAEPAVREGRQDRDTPPEEGGRWPVSLLMRPPRVAAERLAALAQEAVRFAGPGQFLTAHPTRTDWSTGCARTAPSRRWTSWSTRSSWCGSGTSRAPARDLAVETWDRAPLG